jgi:hypothetical protein
MNLFVKLSNFNFVFGLSLDCFHQSRLSEEARTKKNENWPSFGHLAKKIFFFSESFYALCLFHCTYVCHALEGHVPSRLKGCRATSTYNCSDNLGYIWDLNGKQKQLIKNLVHIYITNGKKTRSCAIVYKSLHCLAHHCDILKHLVNAIENVKSICEVKKVKISGIIQLVPSIITTNC